MNVTVLGIDPGSRKTGYALVREVNNTYKVIESGVIAPKVKEIYERIKLIYDELEAIIRRLEPTEAAIELVFYHKNPDSTVKLSYARAAAILAIMRHDIPISDYTPMEIKKAVTGYGRADKNQIQEMVKMLTGVTDMKASDESDAIAVAITRLNKRRFSGNDWIS